MGSFTVLPSLGDLQASTEAQLEALLGAINVIVETEIDSEAEVEAILGAINMIVAAEINTVAKIEALAGAANLLEDTEINSEAKVEALMGVAMATEAEAAAAAASAVGTHTALTSTAHGITAAGEAVTTAATAAAQLAAIGAASASHAAGHQNGGGDEISVAGLSGELADAQPPKAHAIDSHSVGSVAAGYFPVNSAGSIVSSAAVIAKAFNLQGTNLVEAGNNTFLYGNYSYGGLTDGGTVVNNYNGPFKFLTSARANTAGLRAICVGAGVAGTSPVLDLFTVGFYDTGGPTWYDLFQFKGDGTIKTGAAVTSHYMARNGAVVFDGANNRLTSGWRDTFGLSRNAAALATDGYTLLRTDATRTITDNASELALHTDVGVGSTWSFAGYTAQEINRVSAWHVGKSPIYCWVGDIAATNEQGVVIALYKTGDNTRYVRLQIAHVTGAYQLHVLDANGAGEVSRGTTALTDGDVWVAIGSDPENPANYKVQIYQALSSDEPDPGDWVPTAGAASVAWPAGWPQEGQFTWCAASLSYGANPVANASVRKLNIPR